MTTAFSYHRVSTNVQDTKEQVRGNRQYAQENCITVFNEYGDFGKQPNFQQMLAGMPEVKPELILVQGLFNLRQICQRLGRSE